MAITPVRWNKDLPPLEGSPFNFAVKNEEEARKRASLTKNARWPGIRPTAQKSKVPFMLIAGEDDRSASAVSFRYRDGSQKNGVPITEAIDEIVLAVESRRQV